jgi:hypothetical protein
MDCKKRISAVQLVPFYFGHVGQYNEFQPSRFNIIDEIVMNLDLPCII